ncbi:MAG: hypothetical protein OXC01_11725 [Immundisolibacterales bacterium]|nr:hypothetical protein [Immundisolibacterales bacterium]
MRVIQIVFTDEQAEKLDALRQHFYEESLVKLTAESYIPLLVEGHYAAVVELENFHADNEPEGSLDQGGGFTNHH